MKIKLIISFDGSAYCGWQVQKNALSVQEKLQDSVEQCLGKRYNITGCSRTDGGVHANNFCCAVSIENDDISIPESKLPIALNHYLPEDISVKSAMYVDASFHPRYDVKYKEYEYLIYNSEIRSPFLHGKAYQYPKELDVELMEKTAQLFVGEHDFASFMSSGSSVESTVREIYYFHITKENSLVRINIAGNGFLYNMVRILVGTLIEVSEAKKDISDIPNIIEARDRKKAGFTAPPYALYLNKVVY